MYEKKEKNEFLLKNKWDFLKKKEKIRDVLDKKVL